MEQGFSQLKKRRSPGWGWDAGSRDAGVINVDLAEEMTKVIESQRAYSMALKMVQTSDEIETVINNLRG